MPTTPISTDEMRLTPEMSDPCQTSIDILRARVSRYLSQICPGETVWFADHYLPFPSVGENTTVNVVFFGSFLRRFFESGNWPCRSIKIWVLSESVRQVLSQVVGVPDRHIGLIPRGAVFSRSPIEISSRLCLDRVCNLVYSGRISATKNIEMLLRTVSRLQTDHGLPLPLTLFGEFDNLSHPDAARKIQGRHIFDDYRSHLLGLIERLSWKVKPRFAGRVGPHDWLDAVKESSAFISFSTYICEDFGVSLAQAQEAGWPAIVSDWGGHREAFSQGLHRVSPWLIGASYLSPGLIDFHAEIVAGQIAGIFSASSVDPVIDENAETTRDSMNLNLAHEIGLAEIDLVRRRFIERMGPASHLIYRNGIEVFADTPPGRELFAQYRNLFAARLTAPVTYVFVDDSELDDDAFYQWREMALEAFSNASAQGERAIVLTSKELSTQSVRYRLLQARQVVATERGHAGLAAHLEILNRLGVAVR
jgi:glycosyltransferase involved in cell wall biosynthesis